MFAINSTIQAYACGREKDRAKTSRGIASGATLLFDVGVIVLATITTLGMAKIFPKDFLNKNRMIVLQATACTVGSLDLLTLIPQCYTLRITKMEPTNNRRTTSHNVQLDAPPEIPIVNPDRNALIDNFFREHMSTFPVHFNKGFDAIYHLFFNGENNPLGLVERYEIIPQQGQGYQTLRDQAYANAIADRGDIFDHDMNYIESLGREAAYEALFHSVYQKTLELMRARGNLQENVLDQDRNDLFAESYNKAYDASYEAYQVKMNAEHLARNGENSNKRFVQIDMNIFYYDVTSVLSIAQSICNDAKKSAEDCFGLVD